MDKIKEIIDYGQKLKIAQQKILIAQQEQENIDNRLLREYQKKLEILKKQYELDLQLLEQDVMNRRQAKTARISKEKNQAETDQEYFKEQIWCRYFYLFELRGFKILTSELNEKLVEQKVEDAGWDWAKFYIYTQCGYDKDQRKQDYDGFIKKNSRLASQVVQTIEKHWINQSQQESTNE